MRRTLKHFPRQRAHLDVKTPRRTSNCSKPGGGKMTTQPSETSAPAPDPEEAVRPQPPAPRGLSDKIRILIADDHAIVRAGLKQFIANEPDMIVAGEAADGAETLAFVRDNPCDVVLLDLSMPGKNGIDTLR